MDTYSIFREFADSWGLLGMMLFFCGAVLMVFRPGAKQLHREAASIPLRDDHLERCANSCAECVCPEGQSEVGS